jgi:hypothetical protein
LSFSCSAVLVMFDAVTECGSTEAQSMSWERRDEPERITQ